MTELQMGLLGLGALAVVGVLGYNKWQEARQRKQAESVLKASHPDVLLDGDGRTDDQRIETSTEEREGQSEDATPDRIVEPTMTERVEPVLVDGTEPDMPVDPKYKDWLMHGWLEVGDQAIMGADMPPEFAPNIDKPKNGFDVTLHTHDKAQGQRWYEQLSEGGRAGMPFGETFWSPGFGSLTDKFGIPWMINTIPAADWKPSQG